MDKDFSKLSRTYRKENYNIKKCFMKYKDIMYIFRNNNNKDENILLNVYTNEILTCIKNKNKI